MALPDRQAEKGVLPSKEGEILQRGGEELRIYKIRDRLTFCLQLANPSRERLTETPTETLSQFADRWRPRKARSISPHVGQASILIEWQLPARLLDEALESLRNSPEILYASHVYEMEASPGSYLYLANQITAQFAEGLSVIQIETISQPLGLIRSHSLSGEETGNTHCFVVGPTARKNPLKLANELTRHAQVLLAEPNIIVETAPLYRPTDKRYPEQWHLHHRGGQALAANSHVSAEKAWDITRGDRSITIAVTDDGFDLNHPDFQGAGKVVAPRDLKNRDGLPIPALEENHGTAVAGVAIAEETGEGIVGMAPGCSFMPIQTTGFLDDESVEQIFDWAIEQGADVISCSWSPAAAYFPLSRRINRAITKAATRGRNGKGCVVVFSAGNANRPLNGKVQESGWPRNLISGLTQWLSGFAVHPDVITVSACTSLNQKAAYSNWGRSISVAAPSNNAQPNMALSAGVFDTPPKIRQVLEGRAVLTSDRTGYQGYSLDDYTGFGGTSSACPLVAGIAGLMLSANPDLTAREVKQILQTTTDQIVDKSPDPQLGQTYGTYDKDGHSLWFGYGKVNAYKAVKASQDRALRDRALHQTIKATNRTTTAIPDDDPRGLLSAIDISDRGLLQDLKVFIQAEHEFLGDVSFTLLSPLGDSVLLQSRALGRQTRLQRTYSLVSTPAIRRLINTEIRGRWQLQVIDHVAGHTGRLKQWELVFGI